jgi:hypothetical protein
MRSDSLEIFSQLASTPGDGSGGVQCIIENHDAWVHAEDVQAAITTTLRLQVARRDDARNARIESQRTRLQSLVTVLRTRVATAG